MTRQPGRLRAAPSIRPLLLAGLGAAAAAVVAAPANAWFTIGHALCAAAGLEALPEEVPAFLREGGAAAGHASVDPDVWKAREAPQLRAQERPEHYIDSELLEGRPLPPDRYRYLELLRELRLDPVIMGSLPYAVAEGTQRLMMALAEHRRWPEDPTIQAKALVYAGNLAHYAGDLTQPLHTSVHHNGRARPPRWESPNTGIHFKVDALFQEATFDRRQAVEGLRAGVFDDVFAGVLAELASSHALVDRVYLLEPQLAEPGGEGPTPPEVAAFTAERYRACASFFATLVRTAWEQSATVELPRWLLETREWREEPETPRAPVLEPAAVVQ